MQTYKLFIIPKRKNNLIKKNDGIIFKNPASGIYSLGTIFKNPASGIYSLGTIFKKWTIRLGKDGQFL